FRNGASHPPPPSFCRGDSPWTPYPQGGYRGRGRACHHPGRRRRLARRGLICRSELFACLPFRSSPMRRNFVSGTEVKMARDTTDNRPIETVDELVSYLAAGCKPKQAWRIGT